MLAVANPQPVLIIKSPSENKAAKQFLGYEWSTRKGSEGIKYIGNGEAEDEDNPNRNQGIFKMQTPLFNPNDSSDSSKLNHLIRQNFQAASNPLQPEIPEHLQTFASLRPLHEMLDFSRTEFDKAIQTALAGKVEIVSKYPLVRLGTVAEISAGNSAPQERSAYHQGKYPFFRTSDVGAVHLSKNLTKVVDFLNDKGIVGLKLFKKGTILMPKSGASTYLNHRVIMGVDGYVVSHLAAIVANEKEVLTEFLYEVLTLIKAQDMKVNTDYPSLNVGDIESLKIPLPPKKIQTQIIAECQKIDQEYETSRMSIEAYRAKIAKIFSDLEVMAQNQSGG